MIFELLGFIAFGRDIAPVGRIRFMKSSGLNEGQVSQTVLYKKNLVLRCLDGKMTTRQAAMESGLLQRTVQKYIARYKKIGDRAFVHGNLGKKRFSPELEERRKRVENIFLNTRVNGRNPFENITYAMFKVILEEEFSLKAGRTWLVKVLNGVGYKTPAKHRAAKEAVHTYRPRKAHEGELMQADGTSFDWFKDGKIHCIQGFVDDATGCPYLYMTKNECLLGYVEAFRNMAADKGIPKAIYPDKASVFFVNNRKDDGERHLTQFGVMMENMGVDMFPAHSPQAKGRIERFWQTIKRRLPNLFVLRGIDTVEKANEFLLNEFPKLWQKWFPVRPASEESFFVRAAMNEVSEVLRATFPGKVDRGGIFLLKGYKFFCPELCGKNVLIFLNEKEGLWVEDRNNPKKRYVPRLVETDTTGGMPIVMQDLIERVFLRNAKPKFREVYIDIDDVVLSKIRRNKKSVA